MLGLVVLLAGVAYWLEPPKKKALKQKVEEVDRYPQLRGALLDEVGNKWRRPLKELPVNVDIPRLARKITIFTSVSSHKEVVHTPEESVGESPHDETSGIKDLLVALSKHLGEPASQQYNIESNFGEYFKKTADAAHALADFLEEIVGSDSTTAKVLKACNQSIIAPGVLVCL